MPRLRALQRGRIPLNQQCITACAHSPKTLKSMAAHHGLWIGEGLQQLAVPRRRAAGGALAGCRGIGGPVGVRGSRPLRPHPPPPAHEVRDLPADEDRDWGISLTTIYCSGLLTGGFETQF